MKDLYEDQPPFSLAVVGGGPTAAYLVKHLLQRDAPPKQITIYEAAAEAGHGMPYNPATVHPALLANIAPIEVPPLGRSLWAWLAAQHDDRLRDWGLERGDVTERSFLPRMVLGAWLVDEMRDMAREASGRGICLTLSTGTRVVDMSWDASGVTIKAVRQGRVIAARHDAAVLATGHVWPASNQCQWGRFASPWPSRDIDIPPIANVAVLGSSLSAIDAAVALGHRAGEFSESAGGLEWQPAPDRRLKITFLSRGGVLPEADFWCPLPYVPLAICTPDAVSGAIAQGSSGLLDRVFSLVQKQLAEEDPLYSTRIRLGDLNADSFTAAYFAERSKGDAFDHAAANLAEVEANAERQRTVAWRYALLRMHEPVSAIAAHLTRDDRTRFAKGLKKVFVDNYAAVPTQSVKRLLALHRAGALSVEALDPGDSLNPAPQGVILQQPTRARHFTTLIDARGQRALGLAQLPFPTLIRALRRAAKPRADGAVPMEEDFALPRPPGACGTIHCLALPYLLHRDPFAQGLTSCAAMAEKVANSLRVTPVQ